MFLKENQNQISNKKRTKRFWLVLAIFFIVACLIAGEAVLAQRIMPGVKVGSLSLGWQKPETALQLIQQQSDAFNRQGITVTALGRTVIINPLVIAPTDPDLSYEILSFDNEKIFEQAWQVGRRQNPLLCLKDRWLALLGQVDLPVIFQINDEEFEKIMKNNFGDLENPAQEATLIFEGDQPQITPESRGQAFDYTLALAEIRANAGHWQSRPIELILKPDWPAVTQAEAIKIINQIPAILQTAPIALEYNGRQWLINQDQLQSWLKFDSENLAENFTRQPRQTVLALKKEMVVAWLEQIAPAINIETQNAKFKIANGKVIEFQASRDGEMLDLDKTFYRLNNQIINPDRNTISNGAKEKKSIVEAITRITLAKITTGEVNDLGIRELVGVGKSNFSNSPKNRRHNIAVGATALNGILIKPGEEFSLVQTLGNTDAKAGYLPELVIKGNETKPEYGGGLCQIGTTTFRVALDAGLPITARTNHSYRVSYYEPAGTDATIYNPRPDLKFINDTPTHLILQTRIEGDELIFELYGAKDGRMVEQTAPKIFNFVSPPETKIIETLDLKPGEKKCTERAHTGADTEFTRKITYANGEVKEEKWVSHYRPWQEVCLLGVEKLTPVETPTEE